MVAYQTAYLKATTRFESFAASMTLDSATPTSSTSSAGAGAAEDPPAARPTSTARASASGSRCCPNGSRAIAMRWLRSRKSARPPSRRWWPSANRAAPSRNLFDFADRVDATGPQQAAAGELVAPALRPASTPTAARASPAAELILRHAGRRPPANRATAGQPVRRSSMPRRRACSLPLVEDWPMIDRLQHRVSHAAFYLSPSARRLRHRAARLEVVR